MILYYCASCLVEVKEYVCTARYRNDLRSGEVLLTPLLRSPVARIRIINPSDFFVSNGSLEAMV